MQPEQMSFERLKRRLTIIFGGIFALVLAVVVLASSAVFAYAVLRNEEKCLLTMCAMNGENTSTVGKCR